MAHYRVRFIKTLTTTLDILTNASKGLSRFVVHEPGIGRCKRQSIGSNE